MKRLFFVLSASLAVLVVTLPAAAPYFPIDQIKPGMVGTGFTVWDGNKVEEFKVDVLGVLRHVIGTQRDLILARLEMPITRDRVAAAMRGSFAWFRPFAERPGDVEILAPASSGVNGQIATM